MSFLNIFKAFLFLLDSSQCFCGTSYGRYGQAPETDCNMNCPGNGNQKCGGVWRNSVHAVPATIHQQCKP